MEEERIDRNRGVSRPQYYMTATVGGVASSVTEDWVDIPSGVVSGKIGKLDLLGFNLEHVISIPELHLGVPLFGFLSVV